MRKQYKLLLGTIFFLLSMTVQAAAQIEGVISTKSIASQEFKLDGKHYRLPKDVKIRELYNEKIVYTLEQIYPGSFLRVKYKMSNDAFRIVIKAYLIPQ